MVIPMRTWDSRASAEFTLRRYIRLYHRAGKMHPTDRIMSSGLKIGDIPSNSNPMLVTVSSNTVMPIARVLWLSVLVGSAKVELAVCGGVLTGWLLIV